MHQTVIDFARRMRDEYNLNQDGMNVLELGALDFNGSVRNLFNKTTYLGVDMQEGPGVDYVSNAHDLKPPQFYSNDYDMVICAEMLEHDDQFWLTMGQIVRVLKVGGHLLLTARGNNTCGETMFEHGYPHDYYRFMPQSFPRLFSMFGLAMLNLEEDTYHPGWLALGQKA